MLRLHGTNDRTRFKAPIPEAIFFVNSLISIFQDTLRETLLVKPCQ